MFATCKKARKKGEVWQGGVFFEKYISRYKSYKGGEWGGELP